MQRTLAAGEYLDGLVNIVAAEEHTAEEGAQIAFTLILGELTHPVHKVIFAVFKVVVVVLGEVCLRGGSTPLYRAGIRLLLTHKNLEQHRNGKLVLADDCNLVLLADNEAYVV